MAAGVEMSRTAPAQGRRVEEGAPGGGLCRYSGWASFGCYSEMPLLMSFTQSTKREMKSHPNLERPQPMDRHGDVPARP